MPSSITFILPSLVESHCFSYLDDENRQLMERFNGYIKHSKVSSLVEHTTWIANHLAISKNYINSAELMIIGEGLTDTIDSANEPAYWLRADPVMLTATHNGILCRGNRVLNISDEERLSLEHLINDYLSDKSMKLVLADVKQGYLKVNEPVDSAFVPLSDVIGQDITHRLPTDKYWHGLLTDFQMLLNNCKVNQQRTNRGQPTINGFWFWGESKYTANDIPKERVNSHFYTDDLALAGALGKRTNLMMLSDVFEAKSFVNQQYCIHLSELEQAFLQNDMESWIVLYQKWMRNWILPALASVNNGSLTSIKLILGNGSQYQYTGKSKWCFWRNNSVFEKKPQIEVKT